MTPPAYQPVPLSPIDEEKAMLSGEMVGDKEPLLPSAEHRQGCCRRNEQRCKWARALRVLVRLVIFVGLSLAAHTYITSRMDAHRHRQHLIASTGEAAFGELHMPHHGPPGPHGPRPHPPPPEAIECFDVTDESASVNMSLTLRNALAPMFLLPELAETSDISITRTGKEDGGVHMPPGGPEDKQEAPHFPYPPPTRGPRHPMPPGNPPPPPHKPHMPHMPCHGRPSTIMVEVERDGAKAHNLNYLEANSEVADPAKEKPEKPDNVYVCSLRLPMGQTGLGVFADDLTKEVAEEKKKPKCHPKFDFPHLNVKFNVPAGQPFTISSGMPPPPPPMRKPWFHWGRPSHPPPPPSPPHHGPHHGPHHESLLAHTAGAKPQKQPHVIVVSITRIVSEVRKIAGCRGRALMKKIKGQH